MELTCVVNFIDRFNGYYTLSSFMSFVIKYIQVFWFIISLTAFHSNTQMPLNENLKDEKPCYLPMLNLVLQSTVLFAIKGKVKRGVL